MADDVQRQAGVVLTADVSDYNQNIQSSATQTETLIDQVDKLSQRLSRISKVAGASLIGIGAADLAVIGGATKAYASYEHQLSSLNAQAAQTGKSFDAMSGSVNKLRRDFPTTTADAAALIQTLGKMDVPTRNLDQMASTFMKLGGATGENVQGLASSVLQLQNQMGSRGLEQTKRYSNVLSELSDNSSASATGIAQFASQLAPIARTAGMSTTQVLGVSKAFTSAGQDGFRAATAFNTILTDITNSVATGSPDLAKYANFIGVTADQFKKMDVAEYMPRIFKEINRLGPDAISTMNRMGLEGARMISAVQGVSQQGGLGAAMREAGIAYNDPKQSNMERGASAAYEGISNQMTKMRSELSETAESIGKTFAPAAEVFLKAATTMVKAVRMIAESPIGEIAGSLAAVAGVAAGAAGGLLMGAPHLLAAASTFALMRGGHTQGFKDARSGFIMGPSGPMADPDADPTRKLSRTGRNYERMGPLNRALYNRGMQVAALSGQTGAYDPETGRRGIISRAAGLGLRGYAGGMNLLGMAASPLGFRAVDDMSRRDSFLRAGTFGDAFRRGGTSIMESGQRGLTGLTDEFRKANDRAMSQRGFAKLPAFMGFGTGGLDEAGKNSAQRAMEVTSRATRTLGEDMAKAGRATGSFVGRLASATAGLGRLAGGAAVGAMGGVGGMARGLMTSVGPLGLAVGGAMAVSAFQEHAQAEQHKYDPNIKMGQEQSIVEGYTGAIKIATTNTASFAEALKQAEDALPTPQTTKQALEVSADEIRVATSQDRELSNPALAGWNVKGLRAQIAPMWAELAQDPEQLNKLQLDLIQQVGVRGAGQVLNYAQKHAGEQVNVPMAFEDLLKKEPEDRAKMYESLAGMVDTQRDLNLVNKGDVEANKLNRRAMGDFFITMSHELFPKEKGAALETQFEAGGQTQEQTQAVEAFKQTFFPGIESVGIQREPLFGSKDIELEAAIELANQGKRGKAVQELFGQIRESGQGDLLKQYLTPTGDAARYGYQRAINPVEMIEEQRRRKAPGLASTFYDDPVVANAVQNEGDPNAQYLARRRIQERLMDMGVRKGTRALLQWTGTVQDPESPEYQLASFGYQGMQRQLGFQMPYMNRFQQAQVSALQYQAYQAPTPEMTADPAFQQNREQAEDQFQQTKESMYSFYKGIVQAFRQYDIMRSRAEEDFAQQQDRSQYDFNLSRDRQLHDFDLQRDRAETDFHLQRERAEYDYHLQQQYQVEDYHRSRMRAETDYNIARRRAQFDFNLQVRQQQTDFNINRMRQERDYQHQVRLMIEQSARSMQDIYTRIEVKPTWSGEGLLANAEEQLQQFQEQAQNLRQVRRLGLSGDAIKQLGLTDPQNAQQLARLVEDMAADPSLVREFNRNVRERLKAAGVLVRDQDNTAFQEMERQHRISMRRAEDDFDRAMRRGRASFHRAMERQEEDFGRTMDRGAEDFELAMNRSSEAFHLSMERNQEDFGRTMRRNEKDFNTAMDRAAEDYDTSVDRMRQDMHKSFKRAEEDINEMAHEITGNFNDMMDRAISRLSGGVQKMAREVKDTFNTTKRETTQIAREHMKGLYDLYGLEWKDRSKGGEEGRSGRAGGNTYDPGSGHVTQTGAMGTVLKGWSPGQDIHHFTSPTGGELHLSGGEAVMRPEFTQAVGGEKGVERLNKAAREGALSGLNSYFLGGTIPLAGSHFDQHTSGYGFARWAGDFNRGSGFDDYGDPVHAWKSGVISGLYYKGDDSYGRWVTINHPGNQSSLYAHLSRYGRYQQGDKVNAGDVIGHVGSLGNTGTPPTSHLHFEIRGGHVSFGDQASPVAGLGDLGKAIMTSNLNNLPAMKERYKNVESYFQNQPPFSGLPEGTISDTMNRLYRTRARQMINRRGLPGAQGNVAGVPLGDLGHLGVAPGEYGSSAHGVWNAMLAAGFSKKLAAGIMGNMQSESGFDPFIVQGGGHSMNPAAAGEGGYGLVQWSPGSKLIPYLHGQPPSVASEVNALAAQLSGKGPSPERAAGSALRRASTVAEAARLFETEYERHAGAAQPGRVAQAQAIHRKFAAQGGVYRNGAQEVVVGEHGPEAIFPLNDRGADFMASLMRRFAPGMDARSHPVRGSIPASTTNYYNYKVDSSTNFTGPVTVQSQDPNEMARKLEMRRRHTALTQPVLNRSA